MLIAAPSDTPKKAARREPTASMIARTSSIRVSSVGAPLTRSDMPVPRLSNRISRENDESCSSAGDELRIAQSSSRWVTNPGRAPGRAGPRR
jgi:hypothetical protein